MASSFPGSSDVFKTIPNPTTTATNQSDALNDTLSTRLQQHSDAIKAIEDWLIAKLYEPPGSIKMFGGTTIPTGYLLCDGTAVSRSTFSALFAAISTNFGIGNGSSTFNVPDMRGRVAVGTGTGSGLTFRGLATSGGEELHILVTAELASHAHSISDPGHNHAHVDPGHTHGYSDPGHTHTYNQPSTVTGVQAGGATLFLPAASTTGSSVTGISISGNVTGINNSAAFTGISATNGTGSDSGHNTMQPFLVLNYIIKT